MSYNRYDTELYITRWTVCVVGLLELEESLPDVLLKPIIKAPKRCMTTSAGFLKRKYREEKKLADIYQASHSLCLLCTF